MTSQQLVTTVPLRNWLSPYDCISQQPVNHDPRDIFITMESEKASKALMGIPLQYRGPGGAAAVIQNGQLTWQHVWGFADMDKQVPMSADTLMPICSISKQMFCALVHDLQRNPAPAMAGKGDARQQLQTALDALLPGSILHDTGLTVDHLCNNQSGIRDYWALTTLWGARPEDVYSIAQHGPRTRERLQSLHFAPGAEFSYCNTNFHILGRAIEQVTGQLLEELLKERIFRPAGMNTARLGADTAKLAPPCIGYEGLETHGYRPALNRIEWAGDAGVVVSLTDMIAYETFADKAVSDPESWYAHAATNPTYDDGTPSRYKYGLFHGVVEGVKIVGHGGGLRGFRLQRLHAPEKRLSVVVLLNHEAAAGLAAEVIMRQVLGLGPVPKPMASVDPSPEWFGNFFDQETQLLVSVSPTARNAELSISYSVSPETVAIKGAKCAESKGTTAHIDGDVLTVERLVDNRTLRAKRIKPPDTTLPSVDVAAYAGTFYCKEIDSTLHCTDAGGLLYASFDGFLGIGPAQPMRYVGEEIWAMACPRGMDAPAPGTWTFAFVRENGRVTGVSIGCWLARKVIYARK